jgi:hypothetical protein
MNEQFISYLWRNKLLYFPLTTDQGEEVQIVTVGEHNPDAGPDFSNARIKIGNELWAGNVEIHVKASDWLRHNHIDNENYNRIILHVVYENDLKENPLPGYFPTLEIKDCFDPSLYFRYESFMYSTSWIPCATSFPRANPISVSSMAERCIIERIERKSAEIEQIIAFKLNNWEESFYIVLARSFGLKVNVQPFEMLARSLPLTLLTRHHDHLYQLEALLFGQSGLLAREPRDEYEYDLIKEYHFLQKKYGLVPLSGHIWKFMRLRPPSFPTIRIAQFADLIHHSVRLFSKIMECEHVDDIRQLLHCQASGYWDRRYQFGTVSGNTPKIPGEDFYNLLIINTVIPFLFLMGKARDNNSLKEKSIGFLEMVKPERNAITRNWERLDVQINDAFSSQAYIELKTKYCDLKRCLDCRIGHSILGRK